jgi:hypothetical protein
MFFKFFENAWLKKCEKIHFKNAKKCEKCEKCGKMLENRKIHCLILFLI